MDTKEVRARMLTHGGGPQASNVRRAPSSRRCGRLSALQVATYGVLAAVALVCGYVESLVPLPVPVPGIKLGLGNVVVLYALVAFGPRPALAIMLAKVCASALLFGNPHDLRLQPGRRAYQLLRDGAGDALAGAFGRGRLYGGRRCAHARPARRGRLRPRAARGARLSPGASAGRPGKRPVRGLRGQAGPARDGLVVLHEGMAQAACQRPTGAGWADDGPAGEGRA